MTTATKETAIWQALKSRIVMLPAPANFAVAWPSASFTPPMNGAMPQPYIEVLDIPNATTRILIGSDAPQERLGILGLHLMYPTALNASHEVQKQYAGLIAAHFPTDLRLTYQDIAVRIQRAPDIMQALREDAYLRWPISVRWQSYC